MTLPIRKKYPDEDRIATFNFGPKLALGETVASATVLPDPGITATGVAVSLDGLLVTTTLHDGTAGNDYGVECEALTSGGRTLELRLTLEIRDDAN